MSHLSAHQKATEYFNGLRPGPPEPSGATEAYRERDELAYALSRVPMLTPRPLRIIAAGAGFGGIALARAIHTGQVPGASLTVFEKDAGVGGTWWENRYPGCACDVPAHIYQFSWAPNPNWSAFFAPQSEIRDYFKNVVDQHNLGQYIKLSHKVVGAKWNEDRQVWQVEVVRTDGRDLVISSQGVTEGQVGESWVEECDIFVNAGGFFNNWKWPKIPGREGFQGRMLHTAYWPTDADKDIEGKVVSIIGNGSSGVQVLPAVLPHVKKIYYHIRNPTWVTPRMAEKFAGPKGTTLEYSEEQKRTWSENPAEYLAYRKAIEKNLTERFSMYMDNSTAQKQARQACLDNLREALAAKPELLELLTPDYAVGCRRPTPGIGYLEALMSDKVEIVFGSIAEFTQTGIRTDNGYHHDSETIICATGFELSIAPRFPIIGRDNVDLQAAWKNKPESYLSLAAADMPNYFTILGPASPLAHGSIPTSIEFVVRYICKFAKKMQTENISSFCPKSRAVRAYQNHALAFLSRTAWASSCSSTYKNGTKTGELRSLHPGSRHQLYHLLTNPRYEDFEWTNLCPDPDLMFAFMGNGFTVKEEEGTENDFWFIEMDEAGKQIVPCTNEFRANGNLENQSTVNGDGILESHLAVNGNRST
ncbi:hypothetical protein CFD26_105923 [Aspergillus turcosus]|uniref:FAD/NAD(P)-binding domain-containing protein n=1 Tax=Aspergillus turcosus TaxID=1245748 RepID=A0A421D6F2_9EURO|nr:hypothetical protein CFD26_105923 [Aspergillus turcosus]